jgi:hypothetical protein
LKRKELGSKFDEIPEDSMKIRQALKIICKSDLLAKSARFDKKESLEFWFDFKSYDCKEYEPHTRLQQKGLTFPLALVPPGRLQDDVIATLWDDAQFVSLESEVLNALRIIEPEVENIFFVKRKDSSSNERAAIVRVKNVAKLFPLKSMGDGMTRILQLILSMVKAKGGFLLIDEFENGLYYSLQPKVWEVIFKLAQALKVQVFATTHSWDCVKGYRTAWQKSEDQGSFHRISLDIEMKHVYAMPYDCETLDTAVEEEIEMR